MRLKLHTSDQSVLCDSNCAIWLRLLKRADKRGSSFVSDRAEYKPEQIGFKLMVRMLFLPVRKINGTTQGLRPMELLLWRIWDCQQVWENSLQRKSNKLTTLCLQTSNPPFSKLQLKWAWHTKQSTRYSQRSEDEEVTSQEGSAPAFRCSKAMVCGLFQDVFGFL